MTRDTFSTAFLLVALVGLGLLMVRLLAPYATPIGWACVLAAVFHPAYRMMLRVMPRNPSAAAAITTTLVFLLAVVPALVLSGVVAREAVSGYQDLAAFVSANRVQFLDDLSNHWMIAPAWDWAQERLAGEEADPTSFMLSGIRWLSQFVAAHAGEVARNVLGFFVGIGILTFTLFFFLRDGAEMVSYLEESLPMAADDKRRIFERLQTTLLAVVQGLAATALVQAVLMFLGLLIAGVPFALLLSVATFVLAFLPVGGAALVWIPVVIGLFVAGDYLRGALFLAWAGLVISSVDNFVRPLMIGGQAKLPTLLLFFGILGGINLFGLLGLFAGPAVLAAAMSVVTIYRERMLSLREPIAID
ncbi:MAG TPA: AI-2E family transporter [Candidatus Binatia bacterium]|nr:AI-2E family transporter [Candidatus Binatia bacterium]